ncbi:MAG: aldolase [Rhodospirillales bacterium]
MTTHTKDREAIVEVARSLHARGLTFGASGNISVKVEGGWLMTPTGSSLGALDPARLSLLDGAGRHVAGDPPTKEAFLHQGVYAKRPASGAVVHLHSTHAVALSCLPDLDPENALPPLTAYAVMRVGRLALVPYYPPGDEALADAVSGLAERHHALLLANHGPLVAGTGLTEALYAIEELEETAKLHLLLRGCGPRLLTPQQVALLHERFPS